MAARIYASGLVCIVVGVALALHVSALAGAIIASVGYLVAGCAAERAGA